MLFIDDIYMIFSNRQVIYSYENQTTGCSDLSEKKHESILCIGGNFLHCDRVLSRGERREAREE